MFKLNPDKLRRKIAQKESRLEAINALIDRATSIPCRYFDEQLSLTSEIGVLKYKLESHDMVMVKKDDLLRILNDPYQTDWNKTAIMNLLEKRAK